MITNILIILLSFLLVGNDDQEFNIDNYLNKHLSDFNRIEYTIVSPKNINLSSCVIDDSRNVKVTGNFAYVPVRQLNNNGSFKNALITLKLKLFKNVLVSNRTIVKKEYLNINDFEIVEKEVSTLRFAPVDVSSPIDYYRSKLKISENSILQKSMLEKIPDIQIGDRIEAMFINNSVSISFAVTARSEGVIGDLIKIKRDDKKIFKAKIINNSTVKIIE
jgi:flagella basal body P-ring formation protein FlgA